MNALVRHDAAPLEPDVGDEAAQSNQFFPAWISIGFVAAPPQDLLWSVLNLQQLDSAPCVWLQSSVHLCGD
jgi:hypothetical protein